MIPSREDFTKLPMRNEEVPTQKLIEERRQHVKITLTCISNRESHGEFDSNASSAVVSFSFRFFFSDRGSRVRESLATSRHALGGLASALRASPLGVDPYCSAKAGRTARGLAEADVPPALFGASPLVSPRVQGSGIHVRAFGLVSSSEYTGRAEPFSAVEACWCLGIPTGTGSGEALFALRRGPPDIHEPFAASARQIAAYRASGQFSDRETAPMTTRRAQQSLRNLRTPPQPRTGKEPRPSTRPAAPAAQRSHKGPPGPAGKSATSTHLICLTTGL